MLKVIVAIIIGFTINSLTYQELMKKTIKSPDSEQVATRGR